VILDVILSPADVDEPLRFVPTVRLPDEFTVMLALLEVNDETAWLP